MPKDFAIFDDFGLGFNMIQNNVPTVSSDSESLLSAKAMPGPRRSGCRTSELARRLESASRE